MKKSSSQKEPDTEYEKTLGYFLREARIKRGFSQQQMAYKLITTKTTISRYESNERQPDLRSLKLLCTYLNLDKHELFRHITPYGIKTLPIVILVEDEPVQLAGSLGILRKLLPEAYVEGFETADEASEYAWQNPVDVAFLDVRLSAGHSEGLLLAQELYEINPRTNVIFLTAYTEYMGDAFGLHASGYVMKPMTRSKVVKELSNLRYPLSGIQF
ncbi:MAG: response regulator [Lachnospiraceae bacterium]|nr:response regulator [Lachnospiraceae bacterium]